MSAGASDTLLAGARARPALREQRRRLAIEQIGVLGGQVAAGIGNLAFSLVMARLLAPGSFAALASFGALYLLLNMPMTSLTAAASLHPALDAKWRRVALLAGVGAALLGVALAGPLSSLLALSPALIAMLALAAPGAGPLALARGRLFAARRHRTLIASLLIEPAGRLALGLILVPSIGAGGGAAAIVLAGYLSLLTARREGRVHAGGELGAVASSGAGVAVAFLLLAVIQNQDVVLANAVLGRGAAGEFAVVSTLGGITAFTTMTVPMVLLARIRESHGQALGVALWVAAGLGAAIVCVFATAPQFFTEMLFGSRYEPAGSIAGAYLLAMALLGVTRVLAAQLAARRSRSLVAGLLLLPAALQAWLIADAAGSPGAVVGATLAGSALATLGTGGAVALEAPWARALYARAVGALTSRTALALVGTAALALGLRLLVTRGLWIDEATSVSQAQMSFHGMIENLRTSDVHPPLYFALLWLDVHAFGDGELAVRLPSILAGLALIPVVYLAAKDIYDRKAGLMAALLVAIAPQTVWYSQEARMYALFMLFSVLAVWAQVRVLRRGEPRDWVLYGLAAAALIWNQYFGVLVIGAGQIAFAVEMWRRPGPQRRALAIGWALTAAGLLLLIAPLIPYTYHQFVVNQASGRGFGGTPSQAGEAVAREGHPGVYAFLANVVWSIWGYHSNATMVSLVALWPLTMLFSLFLLGRRFGRASWLVALCALLPMAMLFLLGQEKSDLFDMRYFIGAVPLCMLLAARGLTASRLRPVLALLLAASLLYGLYDQQLNSSNPRRYDFRGAVHVIQRSLRRGDVVLYSPSYLSEVIRYYGPHLRMRSLGAGTAAKGAPLTRGAPAVFVVASYFEQRSIAEATRRELSVLERRRRLVRTLKLSNVHVWELR